MPTVGHLAGARAKRGSVGVQDVARRRSTTGVVDVNPICLRARTVSEVTRTGGGVRPYDRVAGIIHTHFLPEFGDESEAFAPGADHGVAGRVVLRVEGSKIDVPVRSVALNGGSWAQPKCRGCHAKKLFLECKKLCTPDTIVLGLGASEPDILRMRQGMSTKGANAAGDGLHFFAVTSATPNPFVGMGACTCAGSEGAIPAPVPVSAAVARVWYPAGASPELVAALDARDGRGFLHAFYDAITDERVPDWEYGCPGFVLLQIAPTLSSVPRTFTSVASAAVLPPRVGLTVPLDPLNDLSLQPLEQLVLPAPKDAVAALIAARLKALPARTDPPAEFRRNAEMLRSKLYDPDADVMSGIVRSWPLVKRSPSAGSGSGSGSDKLRWWVPPVVARRFGFKGRAGWMLERDDRDVYALTNEYTIFHQKALRHVVEKCRACVLVVTRGESDVRPCGVLALDCRRPRPPSRACADDRLRDAPSRHVDPVWSCKERREVGSPCRIFNVH